MSCATATDCVLVGSIGGSSTGDTLLAETRNGSTWTVQPSAILNGGKNFTLVSVSCVSVTFCTTVGTLRKPVRYSGFAALHWDGRTASCVAIGAENPTLRDDEQVAQAWQPSKGSLP